MPPPPLDRAALRARLRAELVGRGPLTGRDARQLLGISQPSFSRLVAATPEVLSFGRSRAVRYAARRPIEGVSAEIPLYEVLPSGSSRTVAILHPAEPGASCYVESLCEEVSSGWHDGLPWFIDGLRPRGFLGRLVPRQLPELELPDDIRFWGDDHTLRYLARYGWDAPGALILGERALERWLAAGSAGIPAVSAHERAQVWPARASELLDLGVPGSSAAGEQPKFLARRRTDHGEHSVLVKFSPPEGTAEARRTADLLICEHLALAAIRGAGRAAARSEVVQAGERWFLEVTRFDRTPAGGRRGVVSLQALDAEHIGLGTGWARPCDQLVRTGILAPESAQTAAWLELFGRLIGNSDMHQGNLAFWMRGATVEGIAPAYDMLPMAYAPRHGQMLTAPLDPPPLRAADGPQFASAVEVAVQFWQAVAGDARVSEGFRAIAAANGGVIADLLGLAGALPS